ncbi:MAG: hypothetical protein HQL24_10340 [Candidatus Omnitrophica bacterium]|nr:hypothetical protein [Candidatus Omnitrophota bacterium]
MRQFLLFILTFGFCGCSLVSDAVRVGYENSNTATKGQTITGSQGLYSVIVPEDYLYLQQNNNALELIGKDMFGTKYTILTRALNALPTSARNDLSKAKDWLINDYIRSIAKDAPEVLYTEEQTFSGKKALYFESFFPRIQKQTMWGIEVEREAIGYANLIFFHDGYFYWLYHSDIYFMQKEIQSLVEDATRHKFKEFLNGFSLKKNSGGNSFQEFLRESK